LRELRSSLYTKFGANPNVYGFPLCTLDTDPEVRPERHVFVENKAPWFDIKDDLPQHCEFDDRFVNRGETPMNLTALVVGTSLAVIIVKKLGQGRSVKSIQLYAALLATFPVYYFVFAIWASDFAALYQEILVSFGFLLLAFIAYKIRSVAGVIALAIGYIAHAIYDVAHDELFVNSGMPNWWPEFCGAVDVIIGLYLLYIAGETMKGRRPTQ